MIEVKYNLDKFLFNEFLDHDNGGIYASINRDGKDLVTEDKLLRDFALSIIVAIESADEKTLNQLTNDISLFKDKKHGGYYEVLDGKSIPHQVASIKTITSQILISKSGVQIHRL